jgi:hypothetical protein
MPIILRSRDCVAEVGFSVGMGTEPSCWYHPCTSTPPVGP